MKRQSKSLKLLPASPGVYFFRGGRGEILYIGKATSLRDRLRSYFAVDLIERRGPYIVDMVAKAKRVTFIKTGSVLEALILEAELIKRHQPRYNLKEKDDKSFNCVLITNEDFPRVTIVRKKDLDSGGRLAGGRKPAAVFGPFPHGAELKVALKIIRKIFPYRDRCEPDSGKPCFNRQIGLCPGACAGEISQSDYRKTINQIKLFFMGKKKKLIVALTAEMNARAKAEQFEKAGELKRKIFALTHIQDISLIKQDSWKGENSGAGSDFRIEAYDVAHFSGKETVGSMTVLCDGIPAPAEYRLFKIKKAVGGSDTDSLREILTRRLAHPEWPFPRLIVVDGGVAQKNVAESVLRERRVMVPVVSVVKDDSHRPKALLGNAAMIKKFRPAILRVNAEAHRFAKKYHAARRAGSFLRSAVSVR